MAKKISIKDQERVVIADFVDFVNETAQNSLPDQRDTLSSVEKEPMNSARDEVVDTMNHVNYL